MSKQVWLGIDLGTQGVRALAADEHGTTLASASVPLASTREGVRHVQRPEDWWAAVCRCCLQVTQSLGECRVSALSIDATSGTVLFVDEHLAPLSEALMYDDGRAAEESAEINARGEAFWAEMGYRTQRSWALPKVLWLARQHPDLLTNGHVAHQNDYIHACLVGRKLPTDSSHALKSGFDLLRNEWPQELFAKLSLPLGIFPDVLPPGSVIGTVSQSAAAATGLPPDCPIVAGMTDGCASQIAAGAVRHGAWNSVLGTTLVLKGASKQQITDPLGVVYCHRSADGTWLPGGASSVGAGVITKLFPGMDLDELSRRASALDVLDAVMYPLSGTGERFPFVAAQAHAFTLGPASGDVEQFAAALLGVACIERLCFDYLRMVGAPVDGPVSITGGGVRSTFWNQLRADVLGMSLHVPASTEAAFGAAVLAASHNGSIEAAVDSMVRTREVLQPRAERHAALSTMYLRLIQALEQRGWLPEQVADFTRAKAHG